MYNKKSLLTKLVFRGILLSKTNIKKNKKQTLIFLRSPKHFNIGKRKVTSFNNKVAYSYDTNLLIFTNKLQNNNVFFLTLLSSIVGYNSLFRINSLKITTVGKISWNN